MHRAKLNNNSDKLLHFKHRSPYISVANLDREQNSSKSPLALYILYSTSDQSQLELSRTHSLLSIDTYTYMYT